MIMRITAGFTVWMLLGGTVGRAEAAPARMRVVVVPFETAQSEVSALVAQRLSELLVAELRRRGRVSLVDPSQVRPRARGIPRKARSEGLLAAEQLYAEGRKKMKRQEFEEAERRFDAALARMEGSLVDLDDYGLLADLHLWHGIAHFRAGENDKSQEALYRALLVRPSLRLDPKRFPPLIRGILEQIRRRVLTGPRGKLRIRSAPGGCEVLVDGVLRGRTPVSVELPTGRHYVRASCGGFEPQATAREVPPGGAVELKFVLAPKPPPSGKADLVAPLLARLRQGKAGAATAARAQAIALGAAAPFTFFGYFVRSGDAYELRSFLLRAVDARLFPMGRTRFALELLAAAARIRTLARKVEQVVAENPPPRPRVVEAPQPVAPLPEGREIRSAGDLARVEKAMRHEEVERIAREERERRFGELAMPPRRRAGVTATPFYRKWWFWTIVGAVVVGGVAGAVGASSGGSSGANVSLRWTPP